MLIVVHPRRLPPDRMNPRMLDGVARGVVHTAGPVPEKEPERWRMPSSAPAWDPAAERTSNKGSGMQARYVEEPSRDLREEELVRPAPDRSKQNSAIGIEHIDGLYGYALVLTRNRVQAEDLVQETYVRALEAVSRLREDSNIKGWLFTILRNLWLNERRRHHTGPSFIELDFDTIAADGTARDSHEILLRKEDAESVRAAIDKLPPEFKEIILLREFEELSYHQIAEVLGCPAGTVMSRLGRARAKLRTLLASRWKTPAKLGNAP